VDDVQNLYKLATSLRKVQISVAALKFATAIQASGGDWQKVQDLLAAIQRLEEELQSADPDLKESELLIRAMRAWQVGQS
jgi:hypothetical protein